MKPRKIIAAHPNNVLFYQDKETKQWRWKIKASNGRIIASSTESYSRKEDALYNFASIGTTIVKSPEFVNFTGIDKYRNEDEPV